MNEKQSNGAAADLFQKARDLDAQSKQDPQLVIALIGLYKRIIRQLQSGEDPLLYAKVNFSLGKTYSDFPMGERSTNLEQAIGCYQEALRVWTPESDSRGYALTQYNLGNCYRDLPTGEREVNLNRAIACYQEALRFL